MNVHMQPVDSTTLNELSDALTQQPQGVLIFTALQGQDYNHYYSQKNFYCFGKTSQNVLIIKNSSSFVGLNTRCNINIHRKIC